MRACPFFNYYKSRSFITGLIFVAFLITTACNKNNRTEALSEETSELIALTDEQLRLAGAELGRPEKRVITDYVECIGRIEAPPYSLYSVYAPAAGFVQSAKLLPGDFVKKGALLTSLQHPDLVKLQRELLEVKSQLPFLESDLRRKETLAAADAASQRALEQAKADWNLHQTRYKGLKAELDLIGIDTKKLEASGDIQSSIRIYAPIDGYITKVNINNGKLASPNDLLFEILDKSHVHLELQVFAKDVGRVQKGQRIECRLPGSDKTYMAEVHLVGQMIDPDTKTTMIHGHFMREPIDLTVGSYVQAHIFTQAQELLTIPLEAIVKEGDMNYVFVKKPKGFAKMAVKIQVVDKHYAAIDSLPFGVAEQIVVKGAYYLNGAMLQSKEAE